MSNLRIINGSFSYNELTFLQFLNEGNNPSNYTEFFNRKDVKNELVKISAVLTEEKEEIFPSINHIFRVFAMPKEKIKVVILGQDCYHNKGSAVGLAFSLPPGHKINPSLQDIYKELKNEGITPSSLDGNLIPWFNQGVFLLNTALTVVSGKPNSHTKIWKKFTELVMEYIGKLENVDWLLFGTKAHSFEKYITGKDCKIIKTSHPAPLGVNKIGKDFKAFLGSNCFKEIRHKINW